MPEIAASSLLPSELAAIDDVVARVTGSRDPRQLLVHFASLPRKAGRRQLASRLVSDGTAVYDLGAFRSCDLAAAEVLRRLEPDPRLAVELFDRGDAEERRMLLRALATPMGDRLLPVLWERAHRQNDATLFASAFLDSNAAARALEDGDWRRIVLRVAFLDFAIDRLFGWRERIDPVLAAMLAEFAEERRSAGRPVWAGTADVAAASGDRRLAGLASGQPTRNPR